MVEVLCEASKSAKFFGPDRGRKSSIDSYVDILRRAPLLSLFPPQLQSWAQKDALHDGLSSYASSAALKSNEATMIWIARS